MNNPDRFAVYATRLKDSPYSREDEWPRYHDDKVLNLANEIVNGNYTCYLVSGYRGVGKTSFILQVQEKADRLIDEKRNSNNPAISEKEKDSECLFVLTNFAKYENHKSLLRRMIRDVYQEYKKKTGEVETAIKEDTKSDRLLTKISKSVQNIFKKKKKPIPFQASTEQPQPDKEKVFKERIEDLYKRTFQDIKTQLSTTDSEELKISSETNVSDLAKKILPSSLQAIIGAGGGWYFIKQWATSLNPTIPIITLAICSVGVGLWALFNILQVTINFTKTNSKESKNTIEDIYDDEIADFKFHEILDSFNDLNYKLVFVLDELDKVSNTELDNLIKEMKPYLLSGKAHFVIVAGQELAYRYLWVYSGDDAVIGSLFSKFYHIPLFTKDNLEEIGRRLINLDNSTPDSISKLSPLFDYLIFKSRRVPRSFIARFRQIVTWEADINNEQKAYITIPDKQITDLHVRSLVMIKEIERLRITPKQHEAVLHDYLITQLFINAQQMIFKKDYPQSIDEYLERYSESDQLADQAYYQNVEEILRDLFSRMIQENIVKEKIVETNQEAKQETSEEIKSTESSKPSPVIKEEQPKSDANESASNVSIANNPELINFKAEWYNFIDALNSFWKDEVKRNSVSKDLANTTYGFLSYFNSIRAVSFTQIQNKSLIDLINDPSLIDGYYRLNNFRNQLQTYSITPLAFQRQLAEFIIKQQIISKVSKDYTEQLATGFDAALVSSSSTSPDILIDFRHSESSESDRSDIEKIIEKLSGYNQVRQKGNIVFVIETFFNPEAKINSSLLTADFNSLVENYNPYYYEKITYYSITNRIEENTIEKLVQSCVEKLTPYQEFSIQKRIEEKERLILTLPKFDPDDPQKYLWGEKPEVGDRKLTAIVTQLGKEINKFSIMLTVTGTENKPLRGFVYFLVHPSFPEEIYKVLAKNNIATLQLDGYEAFTTGVVCDEGKTELELDLNTLEGIPEGFRYKETTEPVVKSSIKRASKRSISVKKRAKK